MSDPISAVICSVPSWAACRRALCSVLSAILIAAACPAVALAQPMQPLPPASAPLPIQPAAVQALGPKVIDYTGPYTSATVGQLKRAGVGVVLRYVGAAKWKSLTRTEANALRSAGIDIAAVYETNANWMLGGRAAGVKAAKIARRAVVACGGPCRPFVYFACDFATYRYSTINACLAGAASVLGADHVGIYGSYSVCSNALRSGYATKAWQTEAWSGGCVLARCTLFQSAHRVDGALPLNYDSNFPHVEDLGQWGYAGPGAMGWAAQVPPVPSALRSLAFPGGGEGWAVGDGPVVLHTTDGGTGWTPQSTTATSSLLSVCFSSVATGWAVGENGTVLGTGDGGTTWSALSAPTTATLRGVAFSTPATGWAVGEGGIVLHTTNGGATWAAQATPTTATLNSVCFADSSLGWAVGENGAVLRTTNGGSRWTLQSTATTATLRSVSFADSVTGCAVGDGGTVLRTTDGGATWGQQSSPTSSTLSAVHLADAGSACAVGESGTVLRASGVGISPFGSVSGIVLNAATGKPIAGVSVSIGSQPTAPTASDGSFVAARVPPGTYNVTLANSRYVTRVESAVVVSAGLRTTLRSSLTLRAATALSAPTVEPAPPQRGMPATLSVTLSPSTATTAAATTMSGWHYEYKTVTKKVKGKKKKVRVWYWRTLFKLKMSRHGGGTLVLRASLSGGKWRVQARFPGSSTYLPSTSPIVSFSVS